jgi:hypothetical protein
MTNAKSKLLMSVAGAALTVGVASAQAPPAQQSAPAEKIGRALNEAPEPAKPGQKPSEPKADVKTDKGAQAPAPASKSTTGQAPDKDDVKSKGANSEPKSPGQTRSDMKADTKAKADAKSDAESPDKSSEKTGDTKSGDTKATTGQGSAGAATILSTEQRTKIRTVIKKENVQRVTNVNFSISVGAQVRRTVRFYPVPVELVQIYPHWRGYDYILVGDQIIVVNPRTQEIVAVLDA